MMFGKSDPYCVCEIPGKPQLKFKTPTINNTLKPVWNFTKKVDLEENDVIHFTIWDSDEVGSDDLLGKATLKLSQCLEGFEGTLPLAEAGKGSTDPSLTVRLEVKDHIGAEGAGSSGSSKAAVAAGAVAATGAAAAGVALAADKVEKDLEAPSISAISPSLEGSPSRASAETPAETPMTPMTPATVTEADQDDDDDDYEEGEEEGSEGSEEEYDEDEEGEEEERDPDDD